MTKINSRLLNVAAILFIFTIVGWLFFVGRSILLPFFIAVIIWYMISLLAETIEKIPFTFFSVPRFISLPLALLIIIFGGMILFDVLSANIKELVKDAPLYQLRLEQVLKGLTERFSLEDELRISQILPENILPRIVTVMTSTVTTIAGFGALVIVYTLLLMLEYTTFDQKIAALFPEKERFAFAFALQQEISARVRHYVQIKTASSLLTGTLTGSFLHIYGVPYATLFGFITFVLNYIPTIGSIIAVIFPAALSLVFFDTLVPFFVVSIVLTLLQFCIGSLLEPRLMGHRLNISPLVIIFALAFWGSIWGVTGMILCVPLTVVMIIISAQFSNTRPIAILLSKDGRINGKFHANAIKEASRKADTSKVKKESPQ